VALPLVLLSMLIGTASAQNYTPKQTLHPPASGEGLPVGYFDAEVAVDRDLAAVAQRPGESNDTLLRGYRLPVFVHSTTAVLPAALRHSGTSCLSAGCQKPSAQHKRAFRVDRCGCDALPREPLNKSGAAIAP